MKFIEGQRYLEQMDTGRIYIWREQIAKRKDMREFFPDFEKEVVEPIEEIQIPVNTLQESGHVTEEFLKTRSKDELRDYSEQVYGVKQNHLKKPETMIKDILELQKTKDIEALTEE